MSGGVYAAAGWMLAVVSAAGAGGGGDASTMSDGELFYAVCSGCHDMGREPAAIRAAIAPRSRKGWILMVEQMRQYARDTANAFSREEADRIVAYLVRISEEETEEVPIPPAPAPIPMPTPPPVAVAVDAQTQPEARPAAAGAAVAATKKKRPLWRPPSPMLGAARWAGYLAVGLAGALLATGLARRRLRRRFRPIHAALALGLFACIAFHTVVLVIEYGTPRMLWLWFGVGSLVIFVATQAGGLLRRRLRRAFLRFHVAGAVAGTVLTVLHWVWIYV